MKLTEWLSPEQRERFDALYNALPAHFKSKIDVDMAAAEQALDNGEVDALYQIADKYGIGAVVRDYVTNLASGQHEQPA
jgi:hypothetical protein